MVLNRINLEILNAIPIDGIDTHIACSGCAAACCKEGVIMPLTREEAKFLTEAGTNLEEHTTDGSFAGKILHRIMHPHSENGEPMKLMSDCGHLTIDEQTGRTICGAYYDERRPKICSDFKMGSYACAILQFKRLTKDQTS